MNSLTRRSIIHKGPQKVVIKQEEKKDNLNYKAAIDEIIKLTENKKINSGNAFDFEITSLDSLKHFLKNNEK